VEGNQRKQDGAFELKPFMNIYPKDLQPGDEIFDLTYGYITVEKVLPFKPEYPKSQIVETSRGRRDYSPDRLLNVERPDSSKNGLGADDEANVEPPILTSIEQLEKGEI
jgi:hypothetical protein